MANRKKSNQKKVSGSVVGGMKVPSKTKTRTNKAGQNVTVQKYGDGSKRVTKSKDGKSVSRDKNAKGKVQTKTKTTASAGKKLEDRKQRTVTTHKSGAKTVTKHTAGKSVTRSTNKKGQTTKSVSKQKTTKSGGLANVTKTTGPKGGKTKTVSKAGKTVIKKTNPKGKTTKQVIKDKPGTVRATSSPGGKGGSAGSNVSMRAPKKAEAFKSSAIAKGAFKGKRKNER